MGFSRIDTQKKREQDEYFEKMKREADGFGQFDKAEKGKLTHNQELRIERAQKEMKKVIALELERNRKYGTKLDLA